MEENGGEILCSIKGDLNYNKLPCTIGEKTSHGWESGELQIVRLSKDGKVQFDCIVKHKTSSYLSKRLLTDDVLGGAVPKPSNPSRCTIKLKNPECGFVIINKANTEDILLLKIIVDEIKRTFNKVSFLPDRDSTTNQEENPTPVNQSATMKKSGKRKSKSSGISEKSEEGHNKKTCRKPLNDVKNISNLGPSDQNGKKVSVQQEKKKQSEKVSPTSSGSIEQQKLKYLFTVIKHLWCSSLGIWDPWSLYEPVNQNKFKDYAEVIKKPMDFGTIRGNILRDRYLTAEECITDINQVFMNCYLYNYGFMAKELEDLQDNYVKQLGDLPGRVDIQQLTSDLPNRKVTVLNKVERRLEYLLECTKVLISYGSELNQGLDLNQPLRNIKKYEHIVKKPMDFGTIARKLIMSKYKKASECVFDINLVFSNCYLINHERTTKKAICLEGVFKCATAKMPGGMDDINAELLAKAAGADTAQGDPKQPEAQSTSSSNTTKCTKTPSTSTNPSNSQNLEQKVEGESRIAKSTLAKHLKVLLTPLATHDSTFDNTTKPPNTASNCGRSNAHLSSCSQKAMQKNQGKSVVNCTLPKLDIMSSPSSTQGNTCSSSNKEPNTASTDASFSSNKSQQNIEGKQGATTQPSPMISSNQQQTSKIPCMNKSTRNSGDIHTNAVINPGGKVPGMRSKGFIKKPLGNSSIKSVIQTGTKRKAPKTTTSPEMASSSTTTNYDDITPPKMARTQEQKIQERPDSPLPEIDFGQMQGKSNENMQKFPDMKTKDMMVSKYHQKHVPLEISNASQKLVQMFKILQRSHAPHTQQVPASNAGFKPASSAPSTLSSPSAILPLNPQSAPKIPTSSVAKGHTLATTTSTMSCTSSYSAPSTHISANQMPSESNMIPSVKFSSQLSQPASVCATTSSDTSLRSGDGDISTKLGTPNIPTPAQSADILLEAFREELSCAICTEELQEPKDLECSHTFCKSCLQKWLDSQHKKTSVSCPVCLKHTQLSDKGLDDLKTSHLIKNLVDQVRSASAGSILNSACKIHQGMIVRINCKTCDQFVCEKCIVICKRLAHDVEDLPGKLSATPGQMLHPLSDKKRKCLDNLQESKKRCKSWKSQVEQIKYMVRQYSDRLKEKIQQDLDAKIKEIEKLSREGEGTFEAYETQMKDLAKEVDRAIQKQAILTAVPQAAIASASEKARADISQQQPQPSQVPVLGIPYVGHQGVHQYPNMGQQMPRGRRWSSPVSAPARTIRQLIQQPVNLGGQQSGSTGRQQMMQQQLQPDSSGGQQVIQQQRFFSQGGQQNMQQQEKQQPGSSHGQLIQQPLNLSEQQVVHQHQPGSTGGRQVIQQQPFRSLGGQQNMQQQQLPGSSVDQQVMQQQQQFRSLSGQQNMQQQQQPGSSVGQQVMQQQQQFRSFSGQQIMQQQQQPGSSGGQQNMQRKQQQPGSQGGQRMIQHQNLSQVNSFGLLGPSSPPYFGPMSPPHFGPLSPSLGVAFNQSGFALNGYSSHSNNTMLHAALQQQPHRSSFAENHGSHNVSQQQQLEIIAEQRATNVETEKVLKKTIQSVPANRMLTFVASGHHLQESPVGQIVYQWW